MDIFSVFLRKILLLQGYDMKSDEDQKNRVQKREIKKKENHRSTKLEAIKIESNLAQEKRRVNHHTASK